MTGILLLYLVLGAACDASGSRQVAGLIGLSVVCVWLGLTAFHELRGGYDDAVALCLVFAAFAVTTFRHSYFLQDSWKATQALTLTLGLRYENFGQPLNALAYPAFPGFQPERFLCVRLCLFGFPRSMWKGRDSGFCDGEPDSHLSVS